MKRIILCAIAAYMCALASPVFADDTTFYKTPEKVVFVKNLSKPIVLVNKEGDTLVTSSIFLGEIQKGKVSSLIPESSFVWLFFHPNKEGFEIWTTKYEWYPYYDFFLKKETVDKYLIPIYSNGSFTINGPERNMIEESFFDPRVIVLFILFIVSCILTYRRPDLSIIRLTGMVAGFFAITNMIPNGREGFSFLIAAFVPFIAITVLRVLGWGKQKELKEKE